MRTAAQLFVGLIALALCAQVSAQQRPSVIKNPDWLRIPTADEVGGVWPVKALQNGLGGKVRLKCEVDLEGLLQDCSVLSEDPAGFGFGTAALALTPKFLFHPSTMDGHPRLAWVTIPINFDLGGGAMGPKRPPPPTGSRVNDRSDIGPVFTLVSSAPWTRTPSSADVQAAYPTHAKPATAFGHVVLVCDFTKEGDLRNCVTNIETPGGQGFGQAAKSLLRLFHLDPATAPGTDLSKVRINLAIHFSRPDAQTRRVIDHPDWISAGDSGGDLFPDAARKAGLATGRAVLDCIADPAGKMSGCQVVSEDPAGLGFGAEALRTAEAMAVNRWTSGGQPVDGAHLIFAVRINKDDGKSTQKPAAVPPG